MKANITEDDSQKQKSQVKIGLPILSIYLLRFQEEEKSEAAAAAAQQE